MPEFDIFNTIYGKMGIFGILCLVVWKVYHDMKSDKKDIVARLNTAEQRHETYKTIDHERCMNVLHDNAISRKELTQAINRMSRATERLPCNLSQPESQRWRTPDPESNPTPPKGNKS